MAVIRRRRGDHNRLGSEVAGFEPTGDVLPFRVIANREPLVSLFHRYYYFKL